MSELAGPTTSGHAPRSFKPPPALYAAAQARAAREGRTLTDVLVTGLRAYVAQDVPPVDDEAFEITAEWLGAVFPGRLAELAEYLLKQSEA